MRISTRVATNKWTPLTVCHFAALVWQQGLYITMCLNMVYVLFVETHKNITSDRFPFLFRSCRGGYKMLLHSSPARKLVADGVSTYCGYPHDCHLDRWPRMLDSFEELS